MHPLVLAMFGFLKGQLHVHSDRSGDSHTPPAEVTRWYAEHRFDFVVMTDHERITTSPAVGDMLVLPGVELTQNLETCSPAPPAGMHCLLHVNALFVTPRATEPWPPALSDDRFDRYVRALDATRALSGIAQLNHPTFHFAADAGLVKRLASRGLQLLEIANQSWDVDNAPAGFPSTEAIWDEVLTAGGVVWGTATDDAHHYYDARERSAAGEPVFVGDRGFVMVRAERNAASIRAAIARGDFYASTGVALARLERKADRLELEVAGKTPCRFRFIGPHGVVLRTSRGTVGALSLAGLKGYVRVVIDDDAGRRAWTQPVWALPAK